jgi:hypothetical protein
VVHILSGLVEERLTHLTSASVASQAMA